MSLFLFQSKCKFKYIPYHLLQKEIIFFYIQKNRKQYQQHRYKDIRDYHLLEQQQHQYDHLHWLSECCLKMVANLVVSQFQNLINQVNFFFFLITYNFLAFSLYRTINPPFHCYLLTWLVSQSVSVNNNFFFLGIRSVSSFINYLILLFIILVVIYVCDYNYFFIFTKDTSSCIYKRRVFPSIVIYKHRNFFFLTLFFFFYNNSLNLTLFNQWNLKILIDCFKIFIPCLHTSFRKYQIQTRL